VAHPTKKQNKEEIVRVNAEDAEKDSKRCPVSAVQIDDLTS